MPGKRKKNNTWPSKNKAHTKNDKRYKRSNRVQMTDCPICGSRSLVEKKSGKYVWAECRSCQSSGYDARFEDNHLIEAVDIQSTIIDANDESSESDND